MRPWQSREGSAVSYRLPLKWHAPIASVAALTAQPLAALPPYGCGVPFTGGERHAGWHYLRHKFIGARPPSLSFRGAKRRGNLLQPVTFSPRPTCYSTWYCEIATSAAPPRNDTSGSAEVHKSTSAVKFSPYRRSLSAATDAIGLYVYRSLYELTVPSRDCHVGLRPPRNDKSGSFRIPFQISVYYVLRAVY